MRFAFEAAQATSFVLRVLPAAYRLRVSRWRRRRLLGAARAEQSRAESGERKRKRRGEPTTTAQQRPGNRLQQLPAIAAAAEREGERNRLQRATHTHRHTHTICRRAAANLTRRRPLALQFGACKGGAQRSSSAAATTRGPQQRDAPRMRTGARTGLQFKSPVCCCRRVACRPKDASGDEGHAKTRPTERADSRATGGASSGRRRRRRHRKRQAQGSRAATPT